MKPALQLKLGQQLTLTPQLRQAIRLLQLSQLELEGEIQLALDSNPLLERDEGLSEASVEAEPAQNDHDTSANDENRDAESVESIGEDAEFDAAWDSAYPGTGGNSEREDADSGACSVEDLHSHLIWQLNLTPMSPRDHAMAMALIDAIDDDGHLAESLESVQETLRPDVEAGLDELEAVLHRIQHFDPIGVGCRTLSECLLVQLGALPEDTPERRLAQNLAKNHLEELARRGIDPLTREYDCSRESLETALELLRSLDPKPGAQINDRPVEYISPDAVVSRHEGQWRVRLAPGARPRLGINRTYEGLIGQASRDDASYLRGQLQEARWLIRSLETRADTVLRVATAIVRHQVGFLEHGPEAMRPLTLRQIADELDLHESTISRVTTRKYLHTPRGTFEFKYFFSSSLDTEGGGSASSTAIQAMIRRLIEAESPRRPLSDAKLASELKNQGITVARRTVAKYREAMNIPSSNERQRLG